ALQLLREGYLVQQVLHEAEGAEPAADEAAQQRAYEEQETHCVEGEPVVPVPQHGLERAYGAGPERARAGIAVEPRDADALEFALVDGALGKAGGVAVRQRRPAQLHRRARVAAQGARELSQGLCTPGRYSRPCAGRSRSRPA